MESLCSTVGPCDLHVFYCSSACLHVFSSTHYDSPMLYCATFETRINISCSHVICFSHFYFYFTKIKYIITNICFCFIFSEAKDINCSIIQRKKTKTCGSIFTINTICRGEKITDLCHGSENKNHSYTYIKNSRNVLHLEYSKYISELFKIKRLEKA